MQEWPKEVAIEVLLSCTGSKAADFMFRWNCLDLITDIQGKYIWESVDFFYTGFHRSSGDLQEGYG